MNITKIKLENFRNYTNQEISFNKGINVIYGDNAQGKTNILEAIFLCSMGKSFRTNKDKELIKLSEDFAKINIEYEKSDRKGKIEYIISNKKIISINGVKIKKLSELLGNINSIIFSPDDMGILKDGPQKRRKFLNMLISQLRPRYLFNLNDYNKTLEQRNNYLRQIKYENKPKNMIDIWNEKLANHAQIIYEYRREFVDKILKKIVDIHKNITNNSEEIKINYISDFKNKEEYIRKLNEKLNKDIERGYTSTGIHKDDFEVYINGKNINLYGSQGQFRTAILSLKLSELYVIYDEIGEYPILLLDDFMSELDEKRRKKFVENITDAQVILTGTHKLILENFDYNIYNVKDGQVKNEEQF
ncbi:MAG TPA: DNA replication/repair protein RecF [Clostridiaceae bacterium]|jgi:DNA replication and repair protein recF|nr:DNA replication/repair protein RecF [Clostridium sp.]MEE0126822.1 DNA replication/repair protein RecF [Clostridia bacterium]HJJ11984.1 DNA replication/repair protein RecF [Clostridiaceae bacterium]